MIDQVTFDLEIIEDPTVVGWDATDRLGVSCGVCYCERHDSFYVYGPNDVERLRQRILNADEVQSFNGVGFDYPVLFGVPRKEWDAHELRAKLLPKSNDLLRRVWTALGFNPDVNGPKQPGWKLGLIAQATLNRSKLGDGAEAPKWFKAGDWPRGVTYCISDVALTRDLCRFADRYGFVRGGNGDKLALPAWRGT
jgi:DEAD/DEAH box helicase domain-containing protein